MKNELPISPNKKFNYSISFEAWDDESLEVGQTDNRGYEVEETTDEIGEILYEANTTYGIYMPFAFGRWESTYPDEDADFFEKGIRKFYTLHITNEDGTEISQEENDFITFLLSDGQYEVNKFRDYAVGGIVLGSIVLGIGALITYFYFKDGKKTSKAQQVEHNGRKYPTKGAWKREHSLENKKEDFEVPQGDRKPLKYEMGGDLSVSKENYFLVVQNWVYFTFNYPMGFIKDVFDSKHIQDKFSESYERFGSIGALMNFWGNLDGDNRKKLSLWIKNNYFNGDKSKLQSISDDDYANIITHWNMFCFNFPYRFVPQVFVENPTHFEQKWNTEYEKAGATGAVNKFFTELSRDNQRLLTDWVYDNYKGSKFEKGGSVNDIDMEGIEKSAKFYTDETRWTVPPTVEKFEAEIKEYQDLKKQLDNKEITPSKIIGKGYKSQYARGLAYKWIKERILIAEKAIEILQSRYAGGGRVTTNDGIIEAFLTSNRELKVGNLATHFNEHDDEILLRNYGTLIATRKGNDVQITNTKYSKTTSTITNKLKNMAMNKGMNVNHTDKFADGGEAVDLEYSDILNVLETKINDAVDKVPNKYENASQFTGEEVEHEYRDGFIPYTDGGYEARWFEYLSSYYSSGNSLPTKQLDTEKERQINYNLESAKESFVEDYPEIVEELGIENVDYNSLYEAGYEGEAEELSEKEMSMFDEDTIMVSIMAQYYNSENDKSIEGKHTIRLFGDVNMESPYHRQGNLDDSYVVEFTFDSIAELEQKMDEGIDKVISWFEGDMYNESNTEMKVRRMAKGGEAGDDSKADGIKKQMYKAFESYLSNKISDEQLVSKLKRILGKRRWFRYFKGDTGASDFDSVKRALSERVNREGEKESMQIALDTKGLQIYDYYGDEMFAKGGYVSKGELVWKKLSSAEKMDFLSENFTPQITPKSQEVLVGKSYNFLPKNVKITLESKYANVEEYAEGGEVEDWMEEALESLIEETGNETLDITLVSNGGNEFYASNENEEYRVFKSEDDAFVTAENEVREDMQDSPENFNKDFIRNYIDGRTYFEQVLNEMNSSYADDIQNESDDKYSNRLISEMVDFGLIDEDDAESDNAEELAEQHKGDFITLMTEEQLNEGNDGLDYFINNFGEEETLKMVMDNNLIDIYKASKDAVQIDGVAHFLSHYDGETLYLSNGYVAFRNN